MVIWVQFPVAAGSSHTKLFMMKWGPQNITDRPDVSIMRLVGVAYGPMTCYPSEAVL